MSLVIQNVTTYIYKEKIEKGKKVFPSTMWLALYKRVFFHNGYALKSKYLTQFENCPIIIVI